MSNSAKESSPGPTARRRKLFVAAGILILAAGGLIFTRNLIDFPVYYAAGQSLLAGRTDLYAPDFARGPVMDYRYLPFFLVALIPLWSLPYAAAAYLWHLVSVAGITASVLVISRISANRKPLTAIAWAVVFFVVAQYFVMALHYGNAHLLAISLMFCSLYFALKQRDLPAGAMAAIAITLKLTPVLLLPYFLVKRRLKLVAATLAFFIAINLLPGFWFGFAGNLKLMRDWYTHVVVNQEFHEANGPINLSLKGQLRRYFTAVDYQQRVDGDVNYRNINSADLPKDHVDWIWKGLAVVIYGFALTFIWRRNRYALDDAGDIGRDAIEIGIMLCVMLLVGPLTSKIYFIALLWPAAVLGRGWTRRPLTLLAAINTTLPLLPGRDLQRTLLVLGIDFYITCAVLALSVYAMIHAKRKDVMEGSLAGSVST